MTTPSKPFTKVVEPYLFFEGRCEEAMEFYRNALGAEVTNLMRYKESPDPVGCPPNSAEKIMHASFRVGETTIMASDGRCEGKQTFQGFALTIRVASIAEAEQFFSALGEGRQVVMPLTQTFFASRFGMVTDRFGVMWMILAEPA